MKYFIHSRNLSKLDYQQLWVSRGLIYSSLALTVMRYLGSKNIVKFVHGYLHFIEIIKHETQKFQRQFNLDTCLYFSAIYDMGNKLEFNCQYKVQGLEYTPLSLDYWYDIVLKFNISVAIYLWPRPVRFAGDI